MDLITQQIIMWGAIAGAVMGIVSLIVKAVKGVKNGIQYFAGLKTSIDTLLEHDDKQYMAILRLTVMSENLPLSERIKAGKEYVDKNGNGDVKAYYEEHLKPYDKVPKGA